MEPRSHHAEVLPRVQEHGAQLLLEQVGLVERLVELHQLVQEQLVLVLKVLPRREQQPLLDLERAAQLVAGSAGEQPAPDLVQGLVHPLHDVEAIEDVHRVAQSAGNDRLIAEVAHHAADLPSAFRAQRPQEPQQAFATLAVPDPHHAACLEVRDDREVDPAAGARDLVHPDPAQVRERGHAIPQRQFDRPPIHPGHRRPRQVRHLRHGRDRQPRAQRRQPLEEPPRHAKSPLRERQPLHPRPTAAGHPHRPHLEVGLHIPDRTVPQPDRLLGEQPRGNPSAALRTLMPALPPLDPDHFHPPPPWMRDALYRHYLESLQPEIGRDTIAPLLVHPSGSSFRQERRVMDEPEHLRRQLRRGAPRKVERTLNCEAERASGSMSSAPPIAIRTSVRGLGRRFFYLTNLPDRRAAPRRGSSRRAAIGPRSTVVPRSQSPTSNLAPLRFARS